MANDNIFGDPIVTPLDATQLGAILDQVQAEDFQAEPAGFKKIQFVYSPPLGAQQNVRCRMEQAAIDAELSRLQLLAGWLTLTGTPSAATRTQVGYSFTPVTAGGVGTKAYTLQAGSLPTGLSLNAATGAVTGTVGAGATTQSFTIRVTDSEENICDLATSITVNVLPTVTTSSPLAGATVGRSYTANQTTAGGTTPKVWSLASGSMPAGLSLNSNNGQITGTPTTPASPATLNMRVTDANSVVSVTVALSLTIAAAVAWSTTTLPNGTVGTAYSQDVTATGGTDPVAITKPTGTLPNGVSLVDNGDRTGTLSGTPTAAGLFSFVLRATDTNGSAADLTITNLRIEIAFSPSSLPNGTVGVAYDEDITSNVGAAGSGPAVLTMTGTLPTGLTFLDNGDGTATIAGTPDPGTAGSYPITVTATDLNAFATPKNYTIVIDP
jgi:hypothetical protein